MGHYSVLKEEAISSLRPSRPNAVFIDGTLGAGGHALEALTRYPDITLVGVDADERMLNRAKERLAGFGERTRFYADWFDHFFLNYPDALAPPDSVLFDLGISMFHYDDSGRGFSFRRDEPLDMRLRPEDGPSAGDLVNSLKEKELADTLFQYGGEARSRRIASAIVQARSLSPILRANELAALIEKTVGRGPREKTHPATKTFQALRIACNRELDRLDRVLPAAFGALTPGGRLGVISFHSLEDVRVKNYFRDLCKSCRCGANILKCACGGALAKPVGSGRETPSAREIAENPASRSAGLRVIEKL